MNCNNCNTENPSGSKYCSNCGSKINLNSENTAVLKLQSKYLLWYLCWVYFSWIFWLIYEKYLVDIFFSTNGSVDWDTHRDVTNYIDWSISSLDVLFLFLIAFLIQNRNYRIILILLALIRIGLFAGYRLL